MSARGSRSRMLRSMVAMALDNDMDVIAEGAESESDVIELFQIGCAFGQGSVFGQNVSQVEARKLMGASTDVAA
jgi:EAL domain-containing protein (putative c-di-GMP-specific phosphodiesterase class I)